MLFLGRVLTSSKDEGEQPLTSDRDEVKVVKNAKIKEANIQLS